MLFFSNEEKLLLKYLLKSTQHINDWKYKLSEIADEYHELPRGIDNDNSYVPFPILMDTYLKYIILILYF